MEYGEESQKILHLSHVMLRACEKHW